MSDNNISKQAREQTKRIVVDSLRGVPSESLIHFIGHCTLKIDQFHGNEECLERMTLKIKAVSKQRSSLIEIIDELANEMFDSFPPSAVSDILSKAIGKALDHQDQVAKSTT